MSAQGGASRDGGPEGARQTQGGPPGPETQETSPKRGAEGKPGAPPLALDALPPLLRECLRAVELEAQCPGELALPYWLGLAASGLQRRTRLKLRTGPVELTSYGLSVAPSGGGKGSGESRPRPFLVELEQALQRSCRDRLAEWDSERRTLRAELDGAETRIAKQRGGAPVRTKTGEEVRTITDEERNALAQKLARHEAERPPEGRIYTGNVTPERVATLLGENGESLLLWTSEGKELLNTGSSYQGPGSTERIDLLLSSYAGESTSVDRANGTRVILRRPRLSAAVAVQPSVVGPWVARYGERGLPQRFWYIHGFREPGTRCLATARPFPPELLGRLREAVARIWGFSSDDGELRAPPAASSLPDLAMSPEAESALTAWHDNEIQPRLRAGGDCHDPEAFRLWMERLHILGCKFACWFHAWEEEDFAGRPVPLDRALRAIRFTESAVEHARMTFDSPSHRPSELGDNAEYLERWLRGRPGWHSPRDVQRANGRRFRVVAQVREAVKELQARGMIVASAEGFQHASGSILRPTRPTSDSIQKKRVKTARSARPRASDSAPDSASDKRRVGRGVDGDVRHAGGRDDCGKAHLSDVGRVGQGGEG